MGFKCIKSYSTCNEDTLPLEMNNKKKKIHIYVKTTAFYVGQEVSKDAKIRNR